MKWEKTNGIYPVVFPKQLWFPNNAKPNLNFYILPSDKERRRCWLQAIGQTQQRLSLDSSLVDGAMQRKCISADFYKTQSNMHQIFTHMYLTVSIGPSHIESRTELFIKKFFVRWSPHFSAFESPNKKPQNRYMLSQLSQRPTTLPPSSEASPVDT